MIERYSRLYRNYSAFPADQIPAPNYLIPMDVVQIIKYDTARRLHFQQHLSFDVIDAFNIFAMSIRSIISAMS